MALAEHLIIKYFDIWTSSIKLKSSAGRGLHNKKRFYGIQKLRDLILQMALIGKLVPQETEEEHAASSLLKARYKLKEAVSQKIIKKQQLPENKKKIAFEKPIPKGWAYATLPEVVQPVPYSIKRGPFGSSIKKDMFVPNGYKVYEQQHAIYDDFSLGEYYLSEKDFHRLKAFEIKPFDVIISCSGTVGRVSIAPKKLKPGVINQALLKISLNQDVLLNEYFKILFPNYFMTLEKLSDLKGTAQKNMPGMPVMKVLPFPLPPVAEQRRIVTKVNQLMEICDQLEKKQENKIEIHNTLVTSLLDTLCSSIAHPTQFAYNWKLILENFDTLFTTEDSLDQLKQTILKLAFNGKLVSQDHKEEPACEILKKTAKEKNELIQKGLIKKQKLPPIENNESYRYELPPSWVWTPLIDICVLENGDRSENYPNKSMLVKEGIPFINAGHLQNGKISSVINSFITEERFKILNSGKFHEGDILFCLRGSLGKSAIVNGFNRGAIASSLVIVRPLSSINENFLQYYFDSPLSKQMINLYDNGTAQPNLSATDLGKFYIPLPPSKEQKRIVDKINELMSICNQLKSSFIIGQRTQRQLADILVEKLSDN
tara:strand:+ start:366 stop:2162 length:1797 start_codon:yes stop_codon:yes gene_type:complete